MSSHSAVGMIFFLDLGDTGVTVVDPGRAKFWELPADGVGVFELTLAMDAWLMRDFT